MKDLTKGNIYKTFLIFAIPMVLSGILSQCYHVVNTIIAGKLLGEGALSAIGAITPVDTFINSVFWGYGVGVGVYIAHLFGAKEYYRMKCVIVNNSLMLSGIIAVMSVFFIIFRGAVMDFFKVDEAVLSECISYFTISMAGKVAVLFSINAVQIIVAMGDSAYPLYMSMLSTLLNIGLGSGFIVFFNMNASALALANVISYTTVGVLYIIKIASCFKKLGVDQMKIKKRSDGVITAARYSAFSCLQQASIYFAGIVLSPMVNNIGTAAAASYIVSLRVYDINAVLYQNSSKTLATYTAQCFGAKKYEGIKKGIKVAVLQSFVFVLPLILVSSFCAPWVSGLFLPQDASADAVTYTVNFLRWGLPFISINVVANLYHNYFRGIGYMSALFVTTVSGSAARIIASFILIPYFGIYGYYAGWIIAWPVDALVGLGYYLFSKRCKALR